MRAHVWACVCVGVRVGVCACVCARVCAGACMCMHVVWKENSLFSMNPKNKSHWPCVRIDLVVNATRNKKVNGLNVTVFLEYMLNKLPPHFTHTHACTCFSRSSHVSHVFSFPSLPFPSLPFLSLSNIIFHVFSYPSLPFPSFLFLILFLQQLSLRTPSETWTTHERKGAFRCILRGVAAATLAACLSSLCVVAAPDIHKRDS